MAGSVSEGVPGYERGGCDDTILELGRHFSESWGSPPGVVQAKSAAPKESCQHGRQRLLVERPVHLDALLTAVPGIADTDAPPYFPLIGSLNLSKALKH